MAAGTMALAEGLDRRRARKIALAQRRHVLGRGEEGRFFPGRTRSGTPADVESRRSVCPAGERLEEGRWGRLSARVGRDEEPSAALHGGRTSAARVSIRPRATTPSGTRAPAPTASRVTSCAPRPATPRWRRSEALPGNRPMLSPPRRGRRAASWGRPNNLPGHGPGRAGGRPRCPPRSGRPSDGEAGEEGWLAGGLGRRASGSGATP